MKYRKKPVVIEARQLTLENSYNICHWINEGLSEIANARGVRMIDGIVTSKNQTSMTLTNH